MLRNDALLGPEVTASFLPSMAAVKARLLLVLDHGGVHRSRNRFSRRRDLLGAGGRPRLSGRLDSDGTDLRGRTLWLGSGNLNLEICYNKVN